MMIVPGGFVDPRRQHLRHRGQAGPSHPDWPPPERHRRSVLGKSTKEHKSQKADLLVSDQRVEEREAADEVRGPEGDPGEGPLLLRPAARVS